VHIGAAHGIVGILQTLLQLEKDELQTLEPSFPDLSECIESTIDSLQNKYCFESPGNLMSSVSSSCTSGKTADRLVHWCHGAPGFVLLLIHASRVFQKPHYLELAKNIATRVVWPRGLLKKGLGLCHGIAGNGMVLLRLSQALEGEERIL
jgi:lantibiotic modifying enzyme